MKKNMKICKKKNCFSPSIKTKSGANNQLALCMFNFRKNWNQNKEVCVF